MDSREIKISNPTSKVALKIIPGHFATSHSHVNYYIDMSTMKTRQSEAGDLARAMAGQYSNSTIVDTIVCLDGCEVIGAYLAQELTNAGILSVNLHKTMYIITPEYNTSGQMIFKENTLKAVRGKHILLLVASVTTGKTVRKSMECIQYYNGIMTGISAIFSAVKQVDNTPINAIFTTDDLPGYEAYKTHDCPFCKANQRLEAIVNSHGYIKL